MSVTYIAQATVNFGGEGRIRYWQIVNMLQACKIGNGTKASDGSSNSASGGGSGLGGGQSGEVADVDAVQGSYSRGTVAALTQYQRTTVGRGRQNQRDTDHDVLGEDLQRFGRSPELNLSPAPSLHSRHSRNAQTPKHRQENSFDSADDSRLGGFSNTNTPRTVDEWIVQAPLSFGSRPLVRQATWNNGLERTAVQQDGGGEPDHYGMASVSCHMASVVSMVDRW